METLAFGLREGGEADFDGWYELFAAVAAEGIWIGRELPLDREERRAKFFESLDRRSGPAVLVVAEADGRIIGNVHVGAQRGIGDLGMMVDAAWRGRGVGSALMAAAVDWAREHDLHKVTLQMWPHNHAARRLYEKFGFIEEGRLRRHYRRRNGELWDAVIMGLVLDQTSPGSPLD